MHDLDLYTAISTLLRQFEQGFLSGSELASQFATLATQDNQDNQDNQGDEHAQHA